MKFLWNLARKNLARSKLRTSVSIIVIAIAIITVVFIRGMISGVIESMYSNHINYKAGHIRVIDEEYKLKERLLSLYYPVDGFNGEGPAQMAEKLKEVEGVEQVIPRLKFGAVVSQEDELMRMIGWGVNTADARNVLKVGVIIRQGSKDQLVNREVVMG